MTESGGFPHKLALDERKMLTMTGVSEVVSFEEDAVVLRTSLGMLTVHGQQLQLKMLSLEGGEVIIEGMVNAFVYAESRQSGGMLRRFFS